MSLPRFFLPEPASPALEGLLVELDAEVAAHLKVLRLRPGAALEAALPSGVWKADLAELDRNRALLRLVVPLDEAREAPVPLDVYLPIPAQLTLLDELLPPLVELGATAIHPVIYARSEYDPKRTAARRERWLKLLRAAAEQSHRGRLPELGEPLPFAALLELDAPQKWVAYELRSGEANPALRREALALTSGPEGGISDEEYAALRHAGWLPVSLGGSILRAITAPVALMGAVQFELNR